MKADIILTSDGSHTLRHPIYQELYHSTHGAITESKHVFIDAGLKPLMETHKEISILEIGLGTALNALLTLQNVLETDHQIKYTSLEPFPISIETAKKLSYCELLEAPLLQDYFEKIHQSAEDTPISITPNFTILKKNQTLEAIQFEETFDLVYFDAFAPATQPQLWEESCLQKIKDALNPKGVLVTYCAKGSFKRTLKSLGFEVEGLPGPPRKREMTRAKIL